MTPTFVAPALAAGRWAVAMLVALVHAPHAAWPLLMLVPFSIHFYRMLMRLHVYIGHRVRREMFPS